MIEFAEPGDRHATVVAALRDVDRRLKSESPADTVACALGIGRDVQVWYDESAGRFFDLASLTKPLFTAPLVLDHFAGRGLDVPVRTVAGWLGGARAVTTIRSLLTHAAGLPGELPATGGVATVRSWLAEQLGAQRSGICRVLYSDANYWLLGDLVSHEVGESLTSLFEMISPLKAGFRFGEVPVARAVRAGPVVSRVQLPHDPAARRLGDSGHAGAFGTLAGVVAAVVNWLDRPRAAEDAFTCQTHATPGGHRSLAWTLAGDPFHVVAHDWPQTTVSHSGFTGVSVALDPGSRWWAVHLTNALPVNRDATPILQARRSFYALAADVLRLPASPSKRDEGKY